MSFSMQMRRSCQQLKDEIITKQNRIILKLFSAFVMDSPVDKGSFRGSWFVQYGSPNLDFIYNSTDGLSPSAATNLSINRMASFLVNFNSGIIWITNNQPYAQRLEYGYSKKAPQGMVRRNVSRFKSIADKA